MRDVSKDLLMIAGIVSLVSLAGCMAGEEVQTVAVPSGTSVEVSLQSSLSTETASTGQSFTAQTTEPIVIAGTTVAPSGTTVQGEVTKVTKPGNVDQGAEMALDFQHIVTKNGDTHQFIAAPITLKAASDTESDIERLAAGTVAGGIIGGIAKGGEGAAIGALVGAGAGGTWAVMTKGDHIVLEPGQKFLLETTEPTELPVLAKE